MLKEKANKTIIEYNNKITKEVDKMIKYVKANVKHTKHDVFESENFKLYDVFNSGLKFTDEDFWDFCNINFEEFESYLGSTDVYLRPIGRTSSNHFRHKSLDWMEDSLVGELIYDVGYDTIIDSLEDIPKHDIPLDITHKEIKPLTADEFYYDFDEDIYEDMKTELQYTLDILINDSKKHLDVVIGQLNELIDVVKYVKTFQENQVKIFEDYLAYNEIKY